MAQNSKSVHSATFLIAPIILPIRIAQIRYPMCNLACQNIAIHACAINYCAISSPLQSMVIGEDVVFCSYILAFGDVSIYIK